MVVNENKENKLQEIIIFGAGSGGIKVAKALESIGYNITAFLDNDFKKWGTKIIEKEILEPKTILDRYPDCIIVIASMFHKEIDLQLQKIGVEKEQIKLAEELIYDYLNNDLEEWKQILQPKWNQEKIVFVEAVQGLGLGGIEQWTRIVVNGLLNRKQPVKILTRQEELENNDRLSKHMIGYDFNEANYLSSLKELVKEISSHLPCTLLLNRINQVYMAAHIVKYYYPEDIHIICVMHNDFERFYIQCKLAELDINTFLCVSSRIKKKMIEDYKISVPTVFKESPIIIDNNFERKLEKKEHLLRIGYAARIEKGQKRSELLIPLVQELEKRKLNYILEIAGDGSFFEQLKERLSNYIKKGTVKLLGCLNEIEMKEFWKRQDVYINVSDMEGCALTMLEAMSYGVVPVMTEVSGTEDFIIDRKNGYLVEKENIKQMAQYLDSISKDHEFLYKAGIECRKQILERCKIDNYIEFLEKLIISKSDF